VFSWRLTDYVPIKIVFTASVVLLIKDNESRQIFDSQLKVNKKFISIEQRKYNSCCLRGVKAHSSTIFQQDLSNFTLSIEVFLFIILTKIIYFCSGKSWHGF
jgi:hypothetical protein